MPATSAALPPLGLIGLGLMGTAVATRLLQAGFSVLGCDLVESCVAVLVRQGGKATSR